MSDEGRANHVGFPKHVSKKLVIWLNGKVVGVFSICAKLSTREMVGYFVWVSHLRK